MITTIDFVIMMPNGTFYPKSRKVSSVYRHHLNAMSFDTESQAKILLKNFTKAKVMKRICTLEEK